MTVFSESSMNYRSHSRSLRADGYTPDAIPREHRLHYQLSTNGFHARCAHLSDRTLHGDIAGRWCAAASPYKATTGVLIIELASLAAPIPGTPCVRPHTQRVPPQGGQKVARAHGRKDQLPHHKHGRNSILSPVKDTCKPCFLWLSVAFPQPLRRMRDIDRGRAHRKPDKFSIKYL